MRRRSSLAERAVVLVLALAAFRLTIACNAVLGIPEVERRAGDDAGSCPLGQKSCRGRCVSILDPSNGCGAEDCRPCALARAKVACVQGECAIEVCEEGFANCNAARADGCEVDLRVDPKNCFACGNDCRELRCSSSTCTCAAGGSCGFGGTCDQQTCVCGETTCSVGAACSDAEACAF